MRRQVLDVRLDPDRLIRAAHQWPYLPIRDPAAAISALRPQKHRFELRRALGALAASALRVCVCP